jgi:hypothetical protein
MHFVMVVNASQSDLRSESSIRRQAWVSERLAAIPHCSSPLRFDLVLDHLSIDIAHVMLQLELNFKFFHFTIRWYRFRGGRSERLGISASPGIRMSTASPRECGLGRSRHFKKSRQHSPVRPPEFSGFSTSAIWLSSIMTISIPLTFAICCRIPRTTGGI